MNPSTGKPLDVGITGMEPHGNAKNSAKFFENGILKAMESEHVSHTNAQEVKVIGNGHCHSAWFLLGFLVEYLVHFSVTENCRRVQGVWMCFGGGG